MGSESEQPPPGLDVGYLSKWLLYHHGRRAVIVATNRARLLGEREDFAGAMLWLEVSRALVKLKAQGAAQAQGTNVAELSVPNSAPV